MTRGCGIGSRSGNGSDGGKKVQSIGGDEVPEVWDDNNDNDESGVVFKATQVKSNESKC